MLVASTSNFGAPCFQSTPGAELDVWEMNHPDLKATHTFAADRKLRPATRKVSAQVSGNAFSYKFPKHSLTILRFRAGA